MSTQTRKLKTLKAEKEEALVRKQAAYERFKKAKADAGKAYTAMRAAWRERSDAREAMNREYVPLHEAIAKYQAIWDTYRAVLAENSPKIEAARLEADREHAESIRCFNQAESLKILKTSETATRCVKEGLSHKARRDELNAEVKALIGKNHEAKQKALQSSVKTDSTAFKAAQAVFFEAKAKHEAAQAEFKRLKTVRDQCKAEFDAAEAEHKKAKEAFLQHLEETQANNPQ